MIRDKAYLLLFAATLLTLALVSQASPVLAEDLGQKPQFRITGFSFDTDAVFESDSGLQLETSRFKPLMITTTAADIFGGDPFADLTGQTDPSPQGFAVAAEYLATPSLAFHGAIGVTKGPWDTDSALNSASSWEANIGVVYKFYNALAYEVHFGYMDTGDVFKNTNAYSDVDSIIMISNQLTMSF